MALRFGIRGIPMCIRASSSTQHFIQARNFKRIRGAGDSGKSSLYSLEKRWKDDHVFEAVGCTDELNSYIGICREEANSVGLFEMEELLTKVQCCLQDLGSHIATPPETSSEARIKRTQLDPALYEELNMKIDKFNAGLPPLKQFILPGGGALGSKLQYARSICRRVERRITRLLREQQIDPSALKYVNRLGDLLFILGRKAAQLSATKELEYKKPKDFGPFQWKTKQL